MLITWIRLAVTQPTPGQQLLKVGSLASVPSLLDLLTLLNLNSSKPVGCFSLQILQVFLFFHEHAVWRVEISL